MLPTASPNVSNVRVYAWGCIDVQHAYLQMLDSVSNTQTSTAEKGIESSSNNYTEFWKTHTYTHKQKAKLKIVFYNAKC